MAEKKATSTSDTGRANASIRSRAIGSIPATLQALNSLRTEERRSALAEAVRSFNEGVVPRPHDTGWVNVLARTFFSYSTDGSSPSRIAWEAVIRGLSVIGCADVDNLGALGEMLAAGDALGVRATVSLETKCYVRSYEDRDINCPGQPGFLRALGVGFTSVPSLDSDHGRFIAQLPQRAHDRNRCRIEKINELLTPVTINYDADVLPLTPAGNPTPEHLAMAYVKKAESVFPEREDQAVFWADVLGRAPQDAEALAGDPAAFREAIWEKFKNLTAEERNPDQYPGVTDFFKAVSASGALPCVYWLNGSTAGESDTRRLLDDAIHWGARAVAVTPDRLWNIADADKKRMRLGALDQLMQAARERSLPVLAGSFMDAPHQKFVDSFDAPELAAYFRDFNDGAFWLYGHATLHRATGYGLQSEWADETFGRNRAAANAFYLEAGKKAPPGKATRVRIANVGPEPDPADILDALAPLRI